VYVGKPPARAAFRWIPDGAVGLGSPGWRLSQGVPDSVCSLRRLGKEICLALFGGGE